MLGKSAIRHFSVPREHARRTGEQAPRKKQSACAPRGLSEAESQIGVRVWTLGGVPIAGGLVAARMAGAVAVGAARVPDGTTTAHRLLNGDGERTQGFVVDRYGQVAMLRLDGAAAEAF